jgi:regulator of RNase E activity RraA
MVCDLTGQRRSPRAADDFTGACDQADGGAGRINSQLVFDDVTVHPGDLIVGDCDGVIAIPRERVAEVIEAAGVRILAIGRPIIQDRHIL